MDLASLAVFRAVAAQQGVTRAAEVLGRAPSNITTRVQQLESELGVPLFHRDKKKMSLTADGVTFLDYACRILDLAAEAQQVVNPHGPMGVLRVGSMEATAAARLAPALAQFNQSWPDVTIELSTAPTRQLLDGVLAHRIDCAFVAIPSGTWLVDPHQLDTRLMFREELVVVLPPGHDAIETPADIVPQALAGFSVGCTYRKLAEDWLAQVPARAAALRFHDVNSYHAMLACTAAGTCFSIMPRSVLGLSPAATDFTVFPLMQIDTHLASRSGFATPAFDEFRASLDPYRNI